MNVDNIEIAKWLFGIREQLQLLETEAYDKKRYAFHEDIEDIETYEYVINVCKEAICHIDSQIGKL